MLDVGRWTFDVQRSSLLSELPGGRIRKKGPERSLQKARKGEITNMTGLTAPYEEPQNPELIVDTNHLTLNQ